MVKWLNSKVRRSIAEAIRKAESASSGEIRVHITSKIRRPALEEAKDLFWKLGMHLTREHSGVLIFIAADSHEFALVGDEGIHARVGDTFWNSARDHMQEQFAKGCFEEGIVLAVGEVGAVLKQFYPRRHDDRNELSNEVSEG